MVRLSALPCSSEPRLVQPSSRHKTLSIPGPSLLSKELNEYLKFLEHNLEDLEGLKHLSKRLLKYLF